jgi:hypothetical protein
MIARVFAAALVVLVAFGCSDPPTTSTALNDAAVAPTMAPSLNIHAPLTITGLIDFSGPPPFPGTFTVVVGSATLGCSGGSFLDELVTLNGVIHSGQPPAIRRTYTCTANGTGTITTMFRPKQKAGASSHWTIVAATGDFVNLHGQGEEVATFVGTTGSSIATGNIFYAP